MTVDLVAAMGMAHTALDVAKKYEMTAPFILKPLANAALQMVDEIAVLRRSLDNLLAHVVDAWDETDIDGSYQTTALKNAIAEALAVLPESIKEEGTESGEGLPLTSMPKGFASGKRTLYSERNPPRTCATCGEKQGCYMTRIHEHSPACWSASKENGQ